MMQDKAVVETHERLNGKFTIYVRRHWYGYKENDPRLHVLKHRSNYYYRVSKYSFQRITNVMLRRSGKNILKIRRGFEEMRK